MPSDLHGWHRQVSGTQAPSELGSRSHPLTLPPEGKHPDQSSLSQAAACTHCPPAPAVCGFHPKEDDVLRLRLLSPCLVPFSVREDPPRRLPSTSPLGLSPPSPRYPEDRAGSAACWLTLQTRESAGRQVAGGLNLRGAKP